MTIHNLQTLNESSPAEAHAWFRDEIVESVHCEAWITSLMSHRPFGSMEVLLNQAERCWRNLSSDNRVQMMNGHPEIGQVEATAHGAMEAAEQQGMVDAEPAVATQIDADKKTYRRKFGFIYMIYATGKSAEELAQALQTRLLHTREQELETATTEFWRIHEKRLRDKLL